jgi:hypothetical protein
MKLKLNDEGKLVHAETGELLEIDGETPEIEGAFTKAQVTETVEARLARERKDHEKLKEAAAQMPELQKLADASAARVRELETELEQTKTSAAQESAAQLTKARQETERYKSAAEQSAAELVRYQVQTAILGAAGSDFNDPANDVVPRLLAVHKREAVKGEDGKPTGEFKDFFKLRYKNDKGEEVDDYLPVDKALEALAQTSPHYLKPSGGSGSGGGNYTTNHGNPKRSEMTIRQKADFVAKHGQEAYQGLPE